MKCLRVEVDRLEKETREEFLARQQSIGKHFAQDAILMQAKKDLFLAAELPPSSRAWDGIVKNNITVTQSIQANDVLAKAEKRRIICEIIFSILRYLSNRAASDRRAHGVANSIWQSIRAMPANFRDDLPDEVGEELFEHPAILTNPFEALQLDIGPSGQYSQLWFIDRIMRHGTLWVGQYYHRLASCHRITDKRTASDVDVQKRHESLYEGKGEIAGEEQQEDEEDNMSPLARSKGKEPMTAKVGHPSEPKQCSNTIFMRQMTRVMLGELMKSQGLMDARINAGTLVAFAEMSKTGVGSEELENRRIKDLFSAFNVDGPCMVATPYNADWEMLPHPKLRSMSVCWVIEPINSTDAPSPGSSPVSSMTESGVSKSTQAMEEAQVAVDGRKIDQKARAFDREDDQVYKIISKVQGLWKLMIDPPGQFVTFV
ncbi:hypothetical protein F5Y10DRAFT_272422 [Nemania abortiva]|nr:hypothetical protein F5Y10DRAFT_272422 [Nemania abortiva]